MRKRKGTPVIVLLDEHGQLVMAGKKQDVYDRNGTKLHTRANGHKKKQMVEASKDVIIPAASMECVLQAPVLDEVAPANISPTHPYTNNNQITISQEMETYNETENLFDLEQDPLFGGDFLSEEMYSFF